MHRGLLLRDVLYSCLKSDDLALPGGRCTYNSPAPYEISIITRRADPLLKCIKVGSYLGGSIVENGSQTIRPCTCPVIFTGTKSAKFVFDLWPQMPLRLAVVSTNSQTADDRAVYCPYLVRFNLRTPEEIGLQNRPSQNGWKIGWIVHNSASHCWSLAHRCIVGPRSVQNRKSTSSQIQDRPTTGAQIGNWDIFVIEIFLSFSWAFWQREFRTVFTGWFLTKHSKVIKRWLHQSHATVK